MSQTEILERNAPAGPSAVTESHGGIQSLDAAVRVLVQLSHRPGAVGVSDLARACDMPVSKVHRYLASFVHAGLVRQNGRSGTYDLGLAAEALGLAALARRDVVNAVSDDLPTLVEATGCTALLSVWSDRGPTVVRWQRAPSPVITSFGLGTTFPLLSSATGRAFLAHTPLTLTESLLTSERARAAANPALLEDVPLDDDGKIDVDALCEGVRAARLAVVDGRFIPGLLACAAPVLNWQDEADVVVTIIGTDPALLHTNGYLASELQAFTRKHSSTDT